MLDRSAAQDLDRIRAMMADVAPRSVPQPTDDRRQARVLERVLAAGDRLAEGPTPDLGTRRAAARRLSLAGVAAVAVAAIAAIGVVQPWSTSNTAAALTPPPLAFEFVEARSLTIRDERPAAEVLRQVAAAAASRPATVASGGVQHLATESWALSYAQDSAGDSAAAIIPTSSEAWIQPDGSVVQVSRRGEPLSPDGRTALPKGDLIGPPPNATDSEPSGFVDASLAATLSRDPAVLRSELDRTASCIAAPGSRAESRCVIRAIRQLYDFAVVPPDLEAALWATLAEDSNLVDLGRTVDRVGRPGIGISLDLSTSGPARFILIIDPDTGQLLGSEDLLLGSGQELGIQTPAVTGFMAYVGSEWTG